MNHTLNGHWRTFKHCLPCVAALAALAMFALPSFARAESVIAVAGPTAGRHADVTSAILLSARKTAAAINASGGLNGEPLTVEAADDGCDAAKAAALATALSARKVALVLGHPCDAAAIAAAKIYAAQSTLFIATTTRHPGLTTPTAGANAGPNTAPDAKRTVFRLSGRDDKQGEDAGRYLATAFKGQTVAIVHDRTKYARAIADAAAITLAKSGAPPPITATLIAGEKDYPLVTAKIKTAAAIFYVGFPLEAGLLHKQLIAAGSKALVVFSASIATTEFAGTFGPAAIGVRAMLPRFAFGDDTSERDSAARNVAAQSALTDTAIRTVAAAARSAKSNDPQKIAGVFMARHLTALPLTGDVNATPEAAASPTPASDAGAANSDGSAAIPFDGSGLFDASGNAQRPSFDVYAWNGTQWQRDEFRPVEAGSPVEKGAEAGKAGR